VFKGTTGCEWPGPVSSGERLGAKRGRDTAGSDPAASRCPWSSLSNGESNCGHMVRSATEGGSSGCQPAWPRSRPAPNGTSTEGRSFAPSGHGRTSRDCRSATGSTTTPGSTRGPSGPWEPLVPLLDRVHALTRLSVFDTAPTTFFATSGRAPRRFLTDGVQTWHPTCSACRCRHVVPGRWCDGEQVEDTAVPELVPRTGAGDARKGRRFHVGEFHRRGLRRWTARN